MTSVPPRLALLTGPQDLGTMRGVLNNLILSINTLTQNEEDFSGPITVYPQGSAAAGSGGVTSLQMDPSETTSTTAKKFTLGFSSTANFTGNPNIVHAIGWNINGAGQRIDTSEAGAWLGMEQEFEVSNGGVRQVENHWQGYDTDGTAYRWIGQSFVRGSLATTSAVQLRAQKLQIQQEDATPLVQFDWANGQVAFAGVTGSSGYYAIMEGTNVGSLSVGGIFQFKPYANGTNRSISQRFAGGSHEFFEFGNDGGAAVTAWLVGPDAFAGFSSGTITMYTGKGIGLGADPGSSSVAGQVVLADGGKITAAGTTTGIYFGAAGDKIAFYAGTPQAKQTLSGSWGGIAAGKNLATLLANLGLLIDSSTA